MTHTATAPWGVTYLWGINLKIGLLAGVVGTTYRQWGGFPPPNSGFCVLICCMIIEYSPVLGIQVSTALWQFRKSLVYHGLCFYCVGLRNRRLEVRVLSGVVKTPIPMSIIRLVVFFYLFPSHFSLFTSLFYLIAFPASHP